MFCEKCGKKLLEGGKHCDNCGQRIGEKPSFLNINILELYRKLPISRRPKTFLAATLIIVGVVFITFGIINYLGTSKLIEESERLTETENFSGAIEKLESAKNKWLVQVLGLREEYISDKIKRNERFSEDKSEYNRGIEEFNKGEWIKARELFSQISEDSPYYLNAKNKIAEIQQEVTEEQIAKAVKEATQTIEAKRKVEEKQYEQKTEELEKKIQELVKTPKNVVSPESASLYFSNSIARVVCAADYNYYYDDYASYNYGSGSIWSAQNKYWIITNEHVLEDADKCIAIVTKDWGAAAEDSERAFQDDKILIYTINLDDSFYVSASGYDMALAVLEMNSETKQSISLLSDVAMLPDTKNCTETFPIGTKVNIFGYPGIGSESVITLTEGVISSFEKVGSAYYYLTSAKIEKGNSGGLALTDIAEGISCAVGIPTFVQTGEIESLGRILTITEKDINYWLSTSRP